LPRIFKLGDEWYSIDVRPDGSAASLEPVQPEFGTLDAGTDSAEIHLLSDTGTHHLTGSDGKWKLPEGRYVSRQIVLNARDGEDAWRLSAYGDTGKLSDFRIGPDEVLDLAVGSPLTLSTEVSAAGSSQAYISLVLSGRAGEEYSPGATKNGQMVEAPTYKIFDEAGELLASGRFEYG
jgi:hypothetical protein